MKTVVFEQYLPITLDEAWNFFASPANLNLITPENLHFRTISEVPDKMYAGLLIRYRIRPMLNIPMLWITKITEYKEKEFFVDEQLQGPYKLWRHEHQFEAVDKGVMMTDRLTYQIGFGILGKLAGKVWVDRQVMKIFGYRRDKLALLFNRKID